MYKSIIDPKAITSGQDDLKTWQKILSQNPKQAFRFNNPEFKNQGTISKVHLIYLFFNIWDLTYGQTAQNQMQIYVNNHWFDRLGPNFKQNLKTTFEFVEQLHGDYVYFEDSIPTYPIKQIDKPKAVTNQWIVDQFEHLFKYLNEILDMIKQQKPLDDYIDDYTVVLHNLYTQKPNDKFITPEFNDGNLTTAQLVKTTSIGNLGINADYFKFQIEEQIHQVSQLGYNNPDLDRAGYTNQDIDQMTDLIKSRQTLILTEYPNAFIGLDGLSKYIYPNIFIKESN